MICEKFYKGKVLLKESIQESFGVEWVDVEAQMKTKKEPFFVHLDWLKGSSKPPHQQVLIRPQIWPPPMCPSINARDLVIFSLL